MTGQHWRRQQIYRRRRVIGLAAAAVGFALGLSGVLIGRGLASFRPAQMRSQVVTVRGARVINDCYNANPSSMKAALRLLAEMGRDGRTIAVVGDMLELGANADEFHRQAGASAAELGIQRLITCGLLGQRIAAGARRAGMPQDHVLAVNDAVEAAAVLKNLLQPGDTVLVKASRAGGLERVVAALRARKETAEIEIRGQKSEVRSPDSR